MKKFVDFKIVTFICAEPSILLLSFRLCGNQSITWPMIIFPFLLSLAIWGLVWALEFVVKLIQCYWIFSVFHAAQADSYRSFSPMYWDPITKQFYSPKYGLMEFEEEADGE